MYGATCEIYTNHKSLKYIFNQKDLNLLQRRWMESIKDSDCTIHYHLSKANVVVDTFSQKAPRMRKKAHKEPSGKNKAIFASIQINSTIINRIKEEQQQNH